MLTTHQYEQIGRLIRREVVPATSCTEPAAVALTVAYAAAVLPGTVQTAEVLLSTNMLKNAMGVGHWDVRYPHRYRSGDCLCSSGEAKIGRAHV